VSPGDKTGKRTGDIKEIKETEQEIYKKPMHIQENNRIIRDGYMYRRYVETDTCT
jgi:hypothetical protein